MFLSERTMIHMQWHKDGERENKDVLVHPLDSDAWKALDNFDPEFAQDERNVRIGLATDGFTPFGDNAASYSCWPMFVVPYNLPHSLCMKYEFIFFPSSYLVRTILDKTQRDAETLDRQVERVVEWSRSL
jgi:hypothetical protein